MDIWQEKWCVAFLIFVQKLFLLYPGLVVSINHEWACWFACYERRFGKQRTKWDVAASDTKDVSILPLSLETMLCLLLIISYNIIIFLNAVRAHMTCKDVNWYGIPQFTCLQVQIIQDWYPVLRNIKAAVMSNLVYFSGITSVAISNDHHIWEYEWQSLLSGDSFSIWSIPGPCCR